MLEVQNDAALVTIHDQVSSRFLTDIRRCHVAGIVPFWGPLDLDYFGSEIGQEQRTDRASHHMGEVDDLQAPQWANVIVRHRSLPHENGVAFFEKSASADAVILAIEHLERLKPLFSGNTPRVFEPLDHALVPARDERRAGGDPPDRGGQFVSECRIGDHAIYEALLQCLVGPKNAPLIEDLGGPEAGYRPLR